MKTTFTLFLALLCSLPLTIQSQIVIESNDMPFAGDTIRTSFAFDVEAFDMNLTGEGYTWDFTALRPVNQRLDTFRNVTETPTYFWPSFLVSANVALRLGSGELLPGIVLDDAYQFFHRSSTAYKDFGYGLILSGIPLPLKFSTPDVLYNFPLQYANNYASDASLEFTLPGLGYLSIERNRTTTADGWGTLRTPFGTFETLRLKSVVYERDSLFADTASQGILVERNYIEYKWLAKNYSAPILQCTDDQLLGRTIVYLDSIRDLSVKVNEEKEFSLSLFPNPVSDKLTVSLPFGTQEPTHMKVLDLFGCEVESSNDVIKNEVGSMIFETSHFKNGVYTLVVVQQGRTFAKRFVVFHP